MHKLKDHELAAMEIGLIARARSSSPSCFSQQRS
jgi:hypothetical protein